MKKTLRLLFSFLLLSAFVASGWKVWQIVGAYARAEESYEELTQFAQISAEPAENVESPQKENSLEALSLPTSEILWPQIDFESLSAINPDVIGWIIIEDTNINYPVVQGEDNDFYLTHQFDKTKNRAGCLFLDIENDPDFANQNQIIYGHYTKDKSMFYQLRGYKQQDFYDAHPTGWLITPSGGYRLHFFSGYVSSVEGDGWQTEFGGESFAKWLSARKSKSLFKSDVNPTEEDAVLTLSTCSYEFDNARFVLHAVMEDLTTP